jgi:cytochrome c oxidase cbb3-type subunit III
LRDAAVRKRGQESYQAKCAACHGTQGQGGIGPNLADEYWLHGGKLIEIVATITDGVPAKGMPPWGPVLSPEEIQSAAVYIRSLLGTNPPNAKASQGERVKLE